MQFISTTTDGKRKTFSNRYRGKLLVKFFVRKTIYLRYKKDKIDSEGIKSIVNHKVVQRIMQKNVWNYAVKTKSYQKYYVLTTGNTLE